MGLVPSYEAPVLPPKRYAQDLWEKHTKKKADTKPVQATSTERGK